MDPYEYDMSEAHFNSLPAIIHHQTGCHIPRSLAFYNQAANVPYWMGNNNALISHPDECEIVEMEEAEDESQEAESEATEDDLLDGLSKWSANRSKRNMQSLKFLSFKAIAANAKRNPYSNPNAAPLPLHILSAPLKSKFVEYLSLTSQRITAENAKQLLHPESVTFDLGIVEKGKQQRETWKFMADNCPLMKTIIWRDLNGVPFVNFPINDLLKMPQVVHIEMPDFWCNDETFKVFAKNFKDLRVLHVSLGEISETAEEMMLELRELRSFDFHGSKLAVIKMERDVKLMATLLQGLPKLQELWPSFPVQCEHSMVLNLLMENDIRVPISLRKLRLNGETHYPLELVQRVESLYLMGTKSNYGFSLCRSIKFPHLQSLCLQMTSLDRRFLHYLLKLYGDQLRELKIEIKQERSEEDVQIDLFDIFTQCPRLVTFHLQGSIACIDTYLSCSNAHFNSLEDVKIRVYGEFRSNLVNCMLFHAPKLRILKLGPVIKLLESNLEYNLTMKIDSEDFDSYSNLEELWLTFQHTEMSDHLLKVLKLTLCSAPNLKKFVLEVMSNPCMRANFHLYRQLAAFCEVHMPDVEVIRIC